MNPDAKEFVPAHILKRRQEEKEAKEATEKTLNDVTDKLDKVDLKSDSQENDSTSSRVSSTDKTNNSSREVQNSSSTTKSSSSSAVDSSNENVKPNNKSTDAQLQNGHSNQENRQYVNNNNNNNQYQGDYSEESQDLNGEDDRYLLNAGENICEFNGEQFIVPGDDGYEPDPSYASQAGYDFGNAEDNEDEDVCNAFEEFLGNLPEE